jgi:hypothetical protein
VVREVRKAGTDVSVKRETLFDFRCNAICYQAKCRLCEKGTVMYFSYLRFHVLAVVIIKKAVLSDVTPCILVHGCRNFRGN